MVLSMSNTLKINLENSKRILEMSNCEDIFSIPKNIVFPDELNRYLRDQIAGLSHENGMLQEHIRESEEKLVQMKEEIHNLKIKIKNEETTKILQFSDSSKTINTKIVELSKSLREKCAEMEKYKTKYSKLLVHLEQLKKRDSEDKPPQSHGDGKSENETLAEMKQLQDKMHITTNKMLEFKNANLQLRNELKQANKFLQQEIGEDLNSLQGNSTWKGRAQIICDLQEKNKKLKEKLKNIQDFGGQHELINQSEKLGGKIASLAKENTELKSLSETYKIKIDTLKSRCNMLETSQQEYKLKVEQAQERSTKELEIIASMSNQLAEIENKKRQMLKEKDNEVNKLKSDVKNLQDQIDDYKALVNNLRVRIHEQTNDNNKNGTKQLKEPSQFQQRQESQKNKICNLEEEKLKLLELIDVQKKRLENERKEHEKCQQLYRLEKQKTIKLETAIATSNLESAATHRSRYSSISQSSRTTESTLRDQLELAEENIKALQTRLQLEQHEKKEDFQEFAKILKLPNNKD